jgi:hypothetical protein
MSASLSTAPSAPTRCDVIRDFAAAWECGLCSARPCANSDGCRAGQTCVAGLCVGRPANCPAGVTPAVCGIPNAANKKLMLFADHYSPANMFKGEMGRLSLRQEERNLQSGIRTVEEGLAAAYPTAAPAATRVAWPDFNYCLWNPTGAPGGPFGHKYFGRTDAQSFGMKPVYPIGGGHALGAVWKYPKQSPVPMSVDYVMNPDLATIVAFAFIVALFGALFYRAHRSAGRPPPGEDAARARCRSYVEKMEASNFDMDAYRVRCGLPLDEK